jgi:hypothetical protein
MARVLALVPDLLFGSRLQAALAAAGHDIELIADEPRLRARLEAAGHGEAPAVGEAPGAAEVLLVDLTDSELDGSGILQALLAEGQLAGVRTLGFYSHVDVDVRERAESAGFDMVVPRSRMAREGAALVASLSN